MPKRLIKIYTKGINVEFRKRSTCTALTKAETSKTNEHLTTISTKRNLNAAVWGDESWYIHRKLSFIYASSHLRVGGCHNERKSSSTALLQCKSPILTIWRRCQPESVKKVACMLVEIWRLRWPSDAQTALPLQLSYCIQQSCGNILFFLFFLY